jgi:hypothetical protein
MQFLSKKIISTVLVLTSLFSYDLQGSWRPYWNKFVTMLWRNKGPATTLAALTCIRTAEPQKQQTLQFYPLPISLNPENYPQDPDIQKAVKAHWGESGKVFIIIETTGKVYGDGSVEKRMRFIKTYNEVPHLLKYDTMRLSDTHLSQEAQQHIAKNCAQNGKPKDPSEIMIHAELYGKRETTKFYEKFTDCLASSKTFGVVFVKPTDPIIKQATRTSPVLIQSNISFLDLLLDLGKVPQKKEKSPQYWDGNLANAIAYTLQTGQPLTALFHNWLGMKNKPQKSGYIRLFEKIGLVPSQAPQTQDRPYKPGLLLRPLHKISSHRSPIGFKENKALTSESTR